MGLQRLRRRGEKRITLIATKRHEKSQRGWQRFQSKRKGRAKQGSVFGGEVVLAPAEAFRGGEELGFGGLEHRTTGEADEIAPAVLAFIEVRTDSPNAGVVMRVWTGSDEETIHCPVVIRAERQAVVGRVIAAHVEGDVGRELAKRYGT